MRSSDAKLRQPKRRRFIRIIDSLPGWQYPDAIRIM
jgi:hypothetical protein